MDWCLKPTDRPLFKRVAGARANVTRAHGDGWTLEAAWGGHLEFRDQQVRPVLGLFRGTLGGFPASSGVTVPQDPLELSVSVAADRAWAGMTGKGIEQAWSEDVPIRVDSVDVDLSLVLAVIEIPDAGDRRVYLDLYPTYAFVGSPE